MPAPAPRQEEPAYDDEEDEVSLQRPQRPGVCPCAFGGAEAGRCLGAPP